MKEDLPGEIEYLDRHDRALRDIMEIMDIPDNLATKLILFVTQNKGALPNRRRTGEFSALTDPEVAVIEKVVTDTFAGYDLSVRLPRLDRE